MTWPTHVLESVAVLDRKSVSPSDVDADTPYLGLEHLDGEGRIDLAETAGTADLKSNKFRFTRDHVLFGKLRPYLRKIARPDFSGICSTDIIPIRPHEQLSREFLFHFLRTPEMIELATSRSSGANLPRLSPKRLAQFEIPLPPLPEQRRIAAILDAADALRAKRREALAQLDTFLQSTFLEMFGDPVTNPMSFPVRILADFYISQKEGTRCGPFGSALKKSELVDSGVAVWTMDNIDPTGKARLPFRMWITGEKYLELNSYAVEAGDVIISRAGTVGKMCVAQTGSAPSIISTNLIRVRFGESLHPQYFVGLMTHCKGRVGRLKTGPDGAFTHMSTAVLDKLSFPYPPLDLQRPFAAIVESVERLKAKQQAHLAELDTLFASLQSRAFRGEL